MIRKRIAIFLVWSIASAWAKSPEKSLTLIKAGQFFDANTGRMLSNQAILVEGERIKEIGDAAALASHAPHAKTIDLTSAAQR